MAQQVLVGTWEEIAQHAPELSGQQVRLVVGAGNISQEKQSEISQSNGWGLEVDIDNLIKKYKFMDYQSILDFLKKNPVIATQLIEAHPYIEAVWGKQTAAKLDIWRDTENSWYDAMYVSIETDESADDALESLRRFDQMWAPHSRGLFQKLSFDVEFV